MAIPVQTHYVSLTGNSDTVTQKSMGAAISITAATKAANCQITVTGHSWLVGDSVYITGVGGMTQLNNILHTVASVVDANNVTLNTNSTAYSTYTSGGTATSGVTKASPCVVTLPNHSFKNGQRIYITSVVGMTQLNNAFYVVQNVTTNRFDLTTDATGANVDSTSFSTYTSAGTVSYYNRVITAITQANPCVVTAPNHGWSNGDYVYFNNIAGMTDLNGNFYKIKNVATDTMELTDGAGTNVDSTGFGAYTSGGTVNKCFATGTAANANNGVAASGDEIRYESTGAHTQLTAANCTWTNNSPTITTSASLVASIAVGDYISRSSSPGNGALETAYRVMAITAGSITIESRYKGTTGTDTASIYKIVKSTSMAAAGNAPAITTSKSVTNSGGWVCTMTTTTQTGETWIQPNGLRSNSGCVSISSSSGLTLSKMNFPEAYGTSISGTSISVSNCSFISSAIYNGLNSTNATYTNCMFNCTSSTSYQPCYVNTAGQTFSGCYAIAIVGGSAVQLNATILGGGITAYNSTTGFNSAVAGGYFYGMTAVDCVTGVACSTNSCTFDTFTITNATTGFNIGTSVVSNTIRNSTLTSCTTYGVYNSHAHSTVVEGCTFTSCGIDVHQNDQYSGQLISIGNSHNTPTNYAYSRIVTGGTIYISECTIDAPSLSKAFQVVAGASYNSPQYSIQNSFFGIYGNYYANGQIIRDTSVLTPLSNYSIKYQYNTTVASNYAEYYITSRPIASGSSGTLTYKVRAAGAWTGTLTPKLKLNGKTIVTGTAITSITNGGWDTKTITFSSGDITADGELSLDWNMVGNNIAINVGDFVWS